MIFLNKSFCPCFFEFLGRMFHIAQNLNKESVYGNKGIWMRKMW